MISLVIRYIIQLIIMLLFLNIIFAKYESSRYPPIITNQRFANSIFKYAWFTRDIHDEEEIVQQQQPYRMKLLENIFYKE